MIIKTLGHYQITGQLGKGGMGEVFLAKDQVLGRDVAIKVLPEEFSRDADRVARFQREAKLLASLNHPNIAAIHGLEESGGMSFLVLELVEGETLADQIRRGPIPVEESLKLALQIAEALEGAHEKGVIHRDLKPANIKVTPDGKAKVLDFGLAKAFAGDKEVNLSHSPTLSDAATQQGIILGTAAYMSAEQAKGKTVDRRADIWAFGVVLFEMLTGRQLFTGETVSETLAAVIKSEPEWERLPPNLHPRIRLLLERCLEKEPKDRYGVIGDARVDIQKALSDPGGVFARPAAAAEPQTKPRPPYRWIAAAVVLTALAAGAIFWMRPAPPTQLPLVTRFEHELPKDQIVLDSIGLPMLAVSSDGSKFVYSTAGGLYMRSAGELEARPIPGVTGIPVAPFFSPDGKWICYWSVGDGQLKKIAVSGGVPVTLARSSYPAGSTWNADNTIMYGQSGTGTGVSIMRVPANGGTPELVVKGQAGPNQFLPDGKSVLCTLTPPPYKVAVMSLKSGEIKELFPGDTPRYLPTGHIVYAVGNNLFAAAFDLNRLEAAGTPVPVIEGVFRLGDSGFPLYAVSDNGTLVYVPQTSWAAATLPQRELVWVDRGGREEPLGALPNSYRSPRISPDGTRVSLSVEAGRTDEARNSSDIWIWDLARKTLSRLTFGGGFNMASIWSPDGKRIAYLGLRNTTSAVVYWKAADGTGKDEPLGAKEPAVGCPSSWSDDGGSLALMELTVFASGTAVGEELGSNIGVLSTSGERKYRLLLGEKYQEIQPRISPNGRWLAYASDESGRYEVYVRPFPEVEGGRWQVSTSGGDSPLWSRDGRELFYRSGDAVMSVSVKTEPSFSLATPGVLFRGNYVASAFKLIDFEPAPWDVSPDGKRFLMMKPRSSGDAAEGRKIMVVMNWQEELKQRVQVR